MKRAWTLAVLASVLTMVIPAAAVNTDHPLVMLRFASSQTRSLAEWKGTAKALAENPGCCGDVWFSTGESFPSLDWHREHLRCLRVAAEDVRKLGIQASLQFEATIGHGDNFPTAEERKIFEKSWTGWTGPDGRECVYCNCPRQPAFLRRLAEVSAIYAEIRPAVVWIDDDLRPTNHFPATGEDGPGCWCATCVAAFAAEEKREWTRETLRADCMRNAALRERWYDFSSRSLAEVACTIARAFRKVSPTTRMGLQTGVDRNRMTPVVVRALAAATGEKVAVRMGGGSYYDTFAPQAGIENSVLMADTRRRLALEDVVGNWCTEIESYPRAYGSRSVRSVALEAFTSLGWGFDTVSAFVIDRRSETDAFYSRYLLRPLRSVAAFLEGYRAANRGTVPAGFTSPGMHFKDMRRLMGLPILPGLGRSWGEVSAEREAFPGLGAVWGDFRPDLLPSFEMTPSAKVQAVRDRLSASAPLEVLSPFVGLVLPRVTDRGELRTIGLVGTRMDEQENVVIRIAADCKAVVWNEPGRPPLQLTVETSEGRRQVTIPAIGAWNVGYIDLR